MAMSRACPFGGSVSRVVAVERGTSEGFLAHGVILIVMRGTPKSWAQVGSRGKVPLSNPVSPPPERACSGWFPNWPTLELTAGLSAFVNDLLGRGRLT